MKYIKVTWMFLLIIFLMGCDTSSNDDELSIQRVEYIGNVLRMDGYFYEKFKIDETNYNIHVFFKNGVMMYVGQYPESELSQIENKLTNGKFYEFAKSDKLSWGVYQIIGDTTIQFEHWYSTYEGPYKGAVRSGKILNDTTFHIAESWRSDGSDRRTKDEIYHFKQLTPKPDSINDFIK